MWNEPSKERLDKIPRLYETEEISLKEKHIYMKFFLDASDWFVAEFDGQDMFFGFTVLNEDFEMAELCKALHNSAYGKLNVMWS